MLGTAGADAEPAAVARPSVVGWDSLNSFKLEVGYPAHA